MTRTDKVLAIIQAGGQGSRLDVLTRERAKPSLPFAGEYRLVDLAMSAIAHSGIQDVWVDVQYMASSLQEYLGQGRPWDLDRTVGGYRSLAGEEGGSPTQSGFATGNADSLYKIWHQIRRYRADLVVVLSADHVFRLDLREVIDQHRARGSECTLVTSEVSLEEAATKAELDVADDGLVREVLYKPASPRFTTVSTEITVYDGELLGAALTELVHAAHAERAVNGEHADEPDSGLGDYGESLLPWFVGRGRTHGFPMAGYWRDVGRPEAYLGAHRDLLAGRIDVFDHEPWVRSHRAQRGPARLIEGCHVSDSVVSQGAVVRGSVVRSVLGPGVVVEAGAHVEDSVLHADVTVRAGAAVHTSVVDERCDIGRGARVGAPPAGTRPRASDMCLVGRESRVRAGAALEPGARLEPGTEA